MLLLPEMHLKVFQRRILKNSNYTYMYTLTPSFISFTTAPHAQFLRDVQYERRVDLEATFRTYVREAYRLLVAEIRQLKDLSVPYAAEDEEKLHAALVRLIEAKRVFWEEREAARLSISRRYRREG